MTVFCSIREDAHTYTHTWSYQTKTWKNTALTYRYSKFRLNNLYKLINSYINISEEYDHIIKAQLLPSYKQSGLLNEKISRFKGLLHWVFLLPETNQYEADFYEQLQFYWKKYRMLAIKMKIKLRAHHHDLQTLRLLNHCLYYQ